MAVRGHRGHASRIQEHPDDPGIRNVHVGQSDLQPVEGSNVPEQD